MERVDRQRCGMLMPNLGEPCDRLVNHRWEHRSRYAMDNQYRAKLGRERQRVKIKYDPRWVCGLPLR